MKRPVLHKRCPNCRINRDFCFCNRLAKVNVKAVVEIVMHQRERILTSNTAYLAQSVISNCRIHIRGNSGTLLDRSHVLEGNLNNTFYLFPSDDAQELNREFVEKLSGPVRLVVPDGTWRQAAKIKRRESFLKQLPSVMIAQGKASRYLLRKNHRPEGLCTFEAIARALGVLEGPQVQEALEKNLDIMVESILRSRPAGMEKLNLMPD